MCRQESDVLTGLRASRGRPAWAHGARAMPPLPGALGTGCDIINKTGEAYSDGSRYTGGATEAPNKCVVDTRTATSRR